MLHMDFNADNLAKKLDEVLPIIRKVNEQFRDAVSKKLLDHDYLIVFKSLYSLTLTFDCRKRQHSSACV